MLFVYFLFVTYRNHSEGGVDHSCSDCCVDRLGHTCSLKDPSGVVKHLHSMMSHQEQELDRLIFLATWGQLAANMFPIYTASIISIHLE